MAQFVPHSEKGPAVPALPPFPASRPRRLRKDAFTRALVREHRLDASDLIYPVFVLDGEQRSQDVASMPGVQRLSVDRLFAQAEHCLNLRRAGDGAVPGDRSGAEDRPMAARRPTPRAWCRVRCAR